MINSKSQPEREVFITVDPYALRGMLMKVLVWATATSPAVQNREKFYLTMITLPEVMGLGKHVNRLAYCHYKKLVSEFALAEFVMKRTKKVIKVILEPGQWVSFRDEMLAALEDVGFKVTQTEKVDRYELNFTPVKKPEDANGDQPAKAVEGQ